MKILFLLLAFCFLQGEPYVRIKNYSDATGKYHIRYEFGKGSGIPQGHSPAPHYMTTITVWKIKGNDSTQIGKPFRGVYTERGCDEDDVPAKVVAKAKDQH